MYWILSYYHQVCLLLNGIDARCRSILIAQSELEKQQRIAAVNKILANLVMEDSRFLGDAHPTYKAMWYWHAVEETEHKAVAYDVYEQCVGDMRALKLHYLHY